MMRVVFLLLSVVLIFSCDQAESRFNEAQRCEKFSDSKCALKNYIDILTNFGTSQFAEKSGERVYEIIKTKTRDFSNIEKEEMEIMKNFAEKFPDSKLGKYSKEYFGKEELKKKIADSIKPLLDKMLIEDYEGIDSFFASGKTDEKFLNTVSVKDRRTGMSVESFNILDVIPKGNDIADIILSRREWYPSSSVTGEVKYLVHLKKSADKWQVVSFELAPVHSLKLK
ncbi:MAG: hypothetical protein N3B13_04610 [Deltaproteobacteria bacterium]|nr:hypothetical protein [Deltaproteobacteria bacterium]